MSAYKNNGSTPPGSTATTAAQIEEGQPSPNRSHQPGERPSTPYGVNDKLFDSHATDPEGIKRAGQHVGANWDANRTNAELVGQAHADYADARRRQADCERERDRWIAIQMKEKPVCRRAVGEPELRDAKGRIKLDALKAFLLSFAVAFLLLSELAGATSLTQVAPWSFINESWGRAALLCFPSVVTGYVQLRNAVKSLRGRRKRNFQRGLMVVGVVIALIGLICLGVSLGDAHRETDGLRPDEPLVPYAALTCLSMLGAALSLVVVEGWLQEKIEACRRYVDMVNPAYERATRHIDRLTDLVGQHEGRAVRAQRDAASLAKDRATWVAWAESEVRRRQHEAATQQQRSNERRRLLEAKHRAEIELNTFEA